MSEKLKLCPFCNGTAWFEADVKYFDDGEEIWHFIECAHCNIRTISYADPEGAIKAWNSRTT